MNELKYILVKNNQLGGYCSEPKYRNWKKKPIF